MASIRTSGLGVLLAAGLALTACGNDPASTSSTQTGSSASAGAQAASNAKCPEVQKKYPALVGKAFKVGTSPGTGNYNNPNPGNPNDVVGVEPDTLRAAATCLGFTVSFAPTSFDGLIPAITSKRIDLISAGMYATPERAKQVSFVEHMTAATAALLQNGNPKKINSLADTCGKKVAQLTGSVENEIQAKQNAACTAEGKKPAEVASYAANEQAANAVRQGRSDYFLTDAGVAAQLAKQFDSDLDAGFAVKSDFAFGFGVDKSNTQLLEGLHAALKLAYDDGSLEKVQQKWGFAKEQKLDPTIVTS